MTSHELYQGTVDLETLNPHTIIDGDATVVNPEGTRDVKILHTPEGPDGYFITHHPDGTKEMTYVDGYDEKVGEIWNARARGDDVLADELCRQYGISDTLPADN